MTVEAFTAGQRQRSLIAVISAVFGVGVAVGAIVPLMSLLLERRGVSATLIGVNGMMFPLAVLVVGPFLPRLVARFGTLPSMYASLAVLAGAILLLPVFPTLPAWFLLRFIAGAAGAVSWIVTETWINLVANDSNRGRIMGVYATVLAVGFATGPLVIGAIGIDGFLPFAIVAGLFAASGVPLMFANGLAPVIPTHSARGVLGLIVGAPLLMFAGLAGGAIETALFTQLPVYGTRIGMATAAAALMLTMYYAGNLVLQVPLGLLADRLNRKRMLIGCIFVTMLCAIALPFTSGHGLLLWALLVVWGGAVMAIYTLSLALMGQIFSGGQLVGANTAFVIMYEIGSVSGPVVAGLAMDGWNVNGLPVTVAVIAAAYLLFAATRPGSR